MAARPPHHRFPFPDQSLDNIPNEARKVVRLLAQHGITSCITGVKALCYYGAARLCIVRAHPRPRTLRSSLLRTRLTDSDALRTVGRILCTNRSARSCQ